MSNRSSDSVRSGIQLRGRTVGACFSLLGGGQAVELTCVPLSIGRSFASQVYLDDEQVSRKHATIHIEAGRVFIEDNDSRNGVWVNGRRVRGSAQVRAGEAILLGQTVLWIVGSGVPEGNQCR